MLKKKQNKRFFIFIFIFLNLYFYVGPYIDVVFFLFFFFIIPHFYLFIYYYFLTQVDQLGGTEPLSSETAGCLCYTYTFTFDEYFAASTVLQYR